MAITVTMNELKLVPIPEKTDTYQPVGHFELADRLKKKAEDILGPALNEKFELGRKGQQLFGVYSFKSPVDDFKTSIGFRNSYDKSLSVGFCSGASVVVCSNLMFAGDFVKHRKHTTNVFSDLEPLMNSTIRNSEKNLNLILNFKDKLKKVEADEQTMFYVFGEVFMGHEFLTSPMATAFKKHYYDSNYFGGDSDNAWRLYNIFTEVLKMSHPSNMIDNHLKIHEYFEQRFLE